MTNLGFKIKEEKGIYKINGERIKTQIIITTDLNKEENIFLKSLRSNLEAKEIAFVLEQAKQHGIIESKNIYLARLIQANVHKFKEAMEMIPVELLHNEELIRDLEKAIEVTILEKRVFAKGKIEGKLEGIEEGKIITALEMLKDELSPITISKYVQMPISWVEDIKNRYKEKL